MFCSLSLGTELDSWGQSLFLGTELVFGDRDRLWGQSPFLGTELVPGDRDRLWGQSSILGGQSSFLGDRARSWGQRSSLRTELVLGGQSSFPGTEIVLGDRARSWGTELSATVNVFEIIMLSRPGSGFLGRDTQVFLPIIQGQPIVISLKCAKFPLIDQGMALSLPITLFSDIAAIMIISCMSYTAISNFIAG